jgi:tetratricopeptide (TPR) repeat protein
MKSEQQTVTIPQAMQIGLEHHQVGRLQEAEQIYREVLQVDPNNPDALHLLGVIAHQVEKNNIAVELIEKAIRVQPSNSSFLNNLGEAYRGLGQISDAESSYRRALLLKPEYAEAHNNLGLVLQDQGKLDEAVASYIKALSFKPDFAKAHGNLGLALKEQGKLEEAVASYRKALSFKPDYVEAHNNLGLALQEQGKLDEAVASYRKALAVKPDYVAAHNNLGNALKEQGKLDEAVASYLKALSVKPDLAEAHNNLGLTLQKQGKPDEAVSCYVTALSFKPDYAEAHNNLGNALKEQGKPDEAVASYRKALSFKPDYAEAHNNLGNGLKDQGKLDEAVASYRKALSFKPDFAETHNNLGLALQEQDKLDEAVASYVAALSFKPDYDQAHSNLGNALKEQGKLDEAVASYLKALWFKPDYAEARNNLGNALKVQGRLDEAIASYLKALSLKPDFAEAHNNLGNALKDQGKLDEAVASYLKALSFKPDFAEAHNNLGLALQDQGQCDEATTSYLRALSVNPDYAEARWSLAISQLRAVYGPGIAPSDCRTAFEAALAELDEWFCAERVKDGFKAVGTQQPFYLAYQEENNRDVLSRYGALCFRLMDDWLQRQRGISADAAPKSVIKLGIVSRYFCNHSVWNALIKGWLQHLDRTRFELHLFYLGTIQDDETSFARINATTFSQGKRELKQWVEMMLGQHLDVLVYPEIGMDPMTVKLASMRLAPVQIATWGHPETTGLPSIDYYLSAEDFEPDNAHANYTERLIELPHLGCCYPLAPVNPAEPDLAALALDPASPLLICPGTPFKYGPQYDWVLVEIARKLGRCQFVFFTHSAKNQSDILQDRLRSIFTQAGLRYDDLVVSIPWQNKPSFYGLMQRADVYLDTIGFSGFNTAMHALECGLPIVTREGKFMRGRLASGILKRMGLSELVVATEDEYVVLAVKLARDATYRHHLRTRIEASRHLLFEDVAPIRALESFLINVTGLR